MCIKNFKAICTLQVFCCNFSLEVFFAPRQWIHAYVKKIKKYFKVQD